MAWNRPNAETKREVRKAKRPSVLRRVYAGVLIVALVVLGIWFFCLPEAGADAEKRGKKTAGIREASPSVAPMANGGAEREVRKADKVAVTTTPLRVAPVVEQPKKVPKAEDVGATNSTGESESEKKKPQPVFKNGVEQLLDMVTPSAPGVRVPPLPIITDDGLKDELKRALENIPKATEDDTEDTIQRKLNVEDLKDEFKQLNAESGMTIAEYVNALRDKRNDDADFMAEASKIDEEVYRDEEVSDEDYKATRQQINDALKNKGLPELESREDDGGEQKQ